MSAIGKQWFLILLFVALAIGLWLGETLEWFSSSIATRNAIVFVVMFMMALPLEIRSFVAVMKKPAAALLGCLMSVGMMPLAMASTLFFLDPSTAAGFVVVGAIPCTLASASVWTRKAGGNEAVAMMVTIVTNTFCFLITPTLIWLSLGSYREIDPLPMIWRLVLLVLLPIALAQLFRKWKPVPGFAANHQVRLRVLAQVGILLMVVIGSVNSRIRYDEGTIQFSAVNLIEIIAVSVLIHGAILGSGFGIARSLKLGRRNALAVAISGSQKTLMVGLVVCDDLGISIVPMVVYHAVQLIFDTIFAAFMNRQESAQDQNEAVDSNVQVSGK